MVIKPQTTKFQIYVIDNIKTLNLWANNPWRKYSLALIIFFIGYFFGSSLGMISAPPVIKKDLFDKSRKLKFFS